MTTTPRIIDPTGTRRINRNRRAPVYLPSHDLRATAIETVLNRIHTTPAVPMTINDMAQATRYSRFHFQRLFTRYTARLRPPMLAAYGATARDYSTIARIEHAKRLLTTTPMNVSDIAMAVGFTSIGSFTTRFTTDIGLTPSDYRDRTAPAHTPRRPGETRPAYARRLLATTAMTVGAIAAAVGYNVTPTFARTFHRANGVTPIQYRRRMQAAAAAAHAAGGAE